jgi:glycosyltransferase involved in cell wall biosynthesis
LELRDGAAPDLATLCQQRNIDLVHVHNIMNPRILNEVHALTSAITVQDHRMFCPGRGKWIPGVGLCHDPFAEDICRGCFVEEAYFQKILATTSRRFEVLSRMELIIVLSAYMKSELVQAGIDAKKIHVLPPVVHGLDPPESTEGLEDEDGFVLFVGRLVEAKGVREVIEAWQRADVGLPLVVAGAGPERGKLDHVPGVRWEGWVSRSRLTELYGSARVMVMASRWQEPYGIVGVEARSMGVPVVAWDSGGVREWLPDEPVPWGDVNGLAQAIREKVGARQEPKESWSAQERWLRLEELYRTLLSGP